MRSGDDIEDIGITSVHPIKIDKQDQDTFAVFNNYRDPFLGESGKELHVENISFNRNPQVRSNTNSSNNRNIANQNVKVQPNNDWPQISYSGTIKNQTTAKTIAVLIIGGKTFTLKQGEEREGIKVLSFTSDEIQLARGKEKKVITK